MRGYPSIKALDYMFESYGNPAYPSPLALVNTFECLMWEAVRAGEARWGRAFKFRPGVRAIGVTVQVIALTGLGVTCER
ncbi:hypothetical protein HMPREF0307_00672 [Corynebacterium sp. DNF00584]|nr:hypothetical protein HMPREF0307_00672 [Corynebacterium sp. DNF00584]OFL78758.1 hypothetical protein HMPREF2748_11775 [Corynebacterium sp. HMSC077B05]